MKGVHARKFKTEYLLTLSLPIHPGQAQPSTLPPHSPHSPIPIVNATTTSSPNLHLGPSQPQPDLRADEASLRARLTQINRQLTDPATLPSEHPRPYTELSSISTRLSAISCRLGTPAAAPSPSLSMAITAPSPLPSNQFSLPPVSTTMPAASVSLPSGLTNVSPAPVPLPSTQPPLASHAQPHAQPHAAPHQPAQDAHNKDSPAQLDRYINRTLAFLNFRPSGEYFIGPRVNLPLLAPTNAVLLANALRAALSFVDPALTPPPDSPHIHPPAPLRDSYSPVRPTILRFVVRDRFGLFNDMASHQLFAFPDIWGLEVTRSSNHITVTDLLRVLLIRASSSRTAVNCATEAHQTMALLPHESWDSLSIRLVRYFRAAHVHTRAPHLSELAYFWRLISIQDLYTLFERFLNILPPRSIFLTVPTFFALTLNSEDTR